MKNYNNVGYEGKNEREKETVREKYGQNVEKNIIIP